MEIVCVICRCQCYVQMGGVHVCLGRSNHYITQVLEINVHTNVNIDLLQTYIKWAVCQILSLVIHSGSQ